MSTYIAKMCTGFSGTSYWRTSANPFTAYQGRYQDSEDINNTWPASKKRIGIFYFSDMEDEIKNSAISEITITFSTAGGLGVGSTKTVNFYASNIQGGFSENSYPEDKKANDYLAVQSDGTPINAHLMSLSSTTWFANTNSSGVTLTFNETQYPDEFQALKNYFEQGNNTLIIYANETKILTDVNPLYTYTQNYVQFTSFEITITYTAKSLGSVKIYTSDKGWVSATPYVFVAGEWKQASAYVFNNNMWQQCNTI